MKQVVSCSLCGQKSPSKHAKELKMWKWLHLRDVHKENFWRVTVAERAIRKLESFKRGLEEVFLTQAEGMNT